VKNEATLSFHARSQRKSPRTRRGEGSPRNREAIQSTDALRVDLRSGRLIALDSDGTVFDSMKAKHENCFIPAFAFYFGVPSECSSGERNCLEEVWRFVNLGSRFRGANRYRALAVSLRLAARHPGCSRAGRRAENLVAALEGWLALENAPSRGCLELALASRQADPVLRKVLDWSLHIDAALAQLAPTAAFRGAVEALPLIAARSDLMILSAAPAASILRDWDTAGLGHYAGEIAGQERGSKSACLAVAMTGRYDAARVLVIGDAPGDLDAARSTATSFYPIVPGREEESWRCFIDDFLPRFLSGETLSGGIADFLVTLRSDPPWKRV
jgi:phosphoglycolate phosphatase-like HAD superfamily hydrolase